MFKTYTWKFITNIILEGAHICRLEKLFLKEQK